MKQNPYSLKSREPSKSPAYAPAELIFDTALKISHLKKKISAWFARKKPRSRKGTSLYILFKARSQKLLAIVCEFRVGALSRVGTPLPTAKKRVKISYYSRISHLHLDLPYFKYTNQLIILNESTRKEICENTHLIYLANSLVRNACYFELFVLVS